VRENGGELAWHATSRHLLQVIGRTGGVQVAAMNNVTSAEGSGRTAFMSIRKALKDLWQ